METDSIKINYKWNSKTYSFSFKLYTGSKKDIFSEFFHTQIFNYIIDCLRRDVERNIQLHSIHSMNNLSSNISEWIESSLLNSVELLEFFDDLSIELLGFCLEDYLWLSNENPSVVSLFVLNTFAQTTFYSLTKKYRLYEMFPNSHKMPLSISVFNLMAWKWISFLYRNHNEKSSALKAKINELIETRNYRNARVAIYPNNYLYNPAITTPQKYNDHKIRQRQILKNFVEILGIIPTQKDMNLVHLFYPKMLEAFLTKKIPSKYFEELIELERIEWFISEEGSWFEALINSSCLENAERKSKYGTWNLSKDGHTCKSIAEKNVDDWLYENDVKHKKEVKYPNSNYIADWKVDGYYIELYGLKGMTNYDLKIIEKKKLAFEGGFKIIELYLDDIINLDKKLKMLKI